MVGLLMAMALTAFPPLAKDRIDLQIGGLLSGPSRTYVDLDAAKVYRSGRPDGGGPGDAAGVATKDLKVVSKRDLSPDEVAALRRIVARALASGLESQPPRPPTADRIIVLDIAYQDRSSSGVVYWPNPEADALIDAVLRLLPPQ